MKKIKPYQILFCGLILFYIIQASTKYYTSRYNMNIIRSDPYYYHEFVRNYIFDKPPINWHNEYNVSKVNVGMAFTYLPGTLIGYFISKITNTNHEYGMNKYYQCSLHAFVFIYMLIGLYYTRLILLRFLNEMIIAIVLALLFFATNIHYYTIVETLFPHIPSFALLAMLIYYTFKWIEYPKYKHAIIVGLVYGLMIIIRPFNIILILIPLIYFLTNQTVKYKLAFIRENILQVLILSLCVLIVLSPQLIYWYQLTGKLLYYSYTGEKFFWNQPLIRHTLFSFRKGWLIYTPIMIFAIIGFYSLFKENKKFFFSFLIPSLLFVFIISCWWAWWFGGSFGLRPMIDIYVLFALPLGLFIKKIIDLKIYFSLPIGAMIVFFTFLNLVQTRQSRIGIIHYDSMTFIAYQKSFLKNKIPENYSSYLAAPNYDEALKGNRLATLPVQ